jgi:hypothetical protein
MQPIDWDKPLLNSQIKNAIQNLESAIGSQCTNLLILELERRGIFFDNVTTYSLNQVCQVLEAIFKKNGSAVFIYFLWKKIAEDESRY